MAQMTDFLEVTIGNVLFRVQAAYKPPAIWIGLWLSTATINDAATGSTTNEVSAGGYARQQITQIDANWNAPTTTGLFDNVNVVTFGPATVAWGIVRYMMICDASTAGNALLHDQIDADRDVQIDDSLEFAAGAIDVTFA